MKTCSLTFMAIENFKLLPKARLISTVSSLMKTPKRPFVGQRHFEMSIGLNFILNISSIFSVNENLSIFGISSRIIHSHVVRALCPQLHILSLATSHRIKLEGTGMSTSAYIITRISVLFITICIHTNLVLTTIQYGYLNCTILVLLEVLRWFWEFAP